MLPEETSCKVEDIKGNVRGDFISTNRKRCNFLHATEGANSKQICEENISSLNASFGLLAGVKQIWLCI